MPKPVTSRTIFPATTRVAVVELSDFFTYRQLSEIIGRDQTTIRQWPDRAREAPEPYVSRLMLTYEIVAQLLMWSRSPDIAGYFHTPYGGRTVTQALHDWTTIDKYDDLLEVIAEGPEALVGVLMPTRRAPRHELPSERSREDDNRDGLRIADAIGAHASVQPDNTIATTNGIIGILRNGRALLDPTPTLQLLPEDRHLYEPERRAHYTQVLLALGWLQPTTGGRSTRPFRLDGKVRRLWDLPGTLVADVRGTDAAVRERIAARRSGATLR